MTYKCVLEDNTTKNKSSSYTRMFLEVMTLFAIRNIDITTSTHPGDFQEGFNVLVITWGFYTQNTPCLYHQRQE